MVPRAIENEVSDFAVDRITQRPKLAQTTQRVVDLQERAINVITSAVVELNDRHIEIDDPTIVS